MNLRLLSERVINCKLCPRLVAYTSEVASRKVRRFSHWEYWGRPVPSFGDPEATIMIVGLAPAAHGGNRTGRMFTGDHSGEWLFKALHEVGLANKSTSISRDDGLQVKGVYITAVVHCAPPDNKPLPQEVENCLNYLREELHLLNRVKVIVALGRLAFDQLCKIYGVKGRFSHGSSVTLPDGRLLIASYHPSARNTNTGKMSWDQWVWVFRRAKELSG
ncbi:uracil-DNA glycosylase [Sulfodiicoccus acidiphilus]|uniref:Type-5 uracil-DNA glycosylase n=1 Tax=Sulfodiicoccus acidiphilus TaxID=1670455 RepID=A0A348B2F9_9CREN|nr:uracil-DNA glycosylase [Sulfodiicoccus acidiphilus]BBD72361.1 uracil-DNA glycosylase [Sulfodiicoccus acidiphilus]GGT90039.1 uracil-DNA glycosylase [Sulfodiicoccus acidiphilus]